MNELIRCARAIAGGRQREDFAFVIGDDGAISDAGDYADVRGRNSAVSTRAFPADRLIVPGFVNGHSHAYQILLRGWADDWGFDRWRKDALYRVVARLSSDDVYWVFVAAFSEMLAAGITSVAEFFYLNGSGNAHAESVLRAAQETGIRLVLARAWMDAVHAPEAFRETPDDAVARTSALRSAYPSAAICIAPHSLHAASETMLRAAVDFSRENACDLHVHVAETREDVALSMETFGKTPVLALDGVGLFTQRTVVVHAIYVTDEEKALLGERRVRVVRNPMTNAYLGDGLGDVSGFRDRGIPVGLGTDANVKPSIFDEMRAASYEQKTVRADGSALDAAGAFALGTSEGARAIGAEAGDLARGLAADFVVLAAAEIDPWSPWVNAVVYRGERAWVQASFVGGRRVFTGEASPLAVRAKAESARIVARLA